MAKAEIFHLFFTRQAKAWRKIQVFAPWLQPGVIKELIENWL